MSDNNSSNPQVSEETLNNKEEEAQAAGLKDEDDDMLRDIIMWRRRKISAALMAVATLLWVLLEIYRFNFLPLASWTAIAFITLLFLYACILSLLRKEVGEMKGWEISEERAKEMAEWGKRGIEKGIRLMFDISCERECYVFAAVVSALLLLAYLGRHFSFLTLLYAGTMVGMTVPVIYMKKEKEIRDYGGRVRMQASRMYSIVNHKTFRPKKKEVKEIKQKKVE